VSRVDPPAAPRRRPWLPVALLVAIGAAGVGLMQLVKPKPVKPPPADPYDWSVPSTTPRGEPIAPKTELRAGDAFTGRGTLSYRQEAAGRFGKAPRFPARDVEGTFTSTRRVAAAADGHRTVTVEASLTATERRDGGDAKPIASKLTFSFPDGVDGPMSTKEARLEVADELRETVEPIVSAFTGRTPLPKRPVRVGEVIELEDVVDVEPIRRQAFTLFMYRNRGVAPVEGRVWVEGVVRSESGQDALHVATVLHHEQAGPVSPEGKPDVGTAYETVVKSVARVGIADGAPRDLDWEASRRMHVVGPDFDYVVDVRLKATVREERAEGREERPGR
jgi:hypothetical protein